MTRRITVSIPIYVIFIALLIAGFASHSFKQRKYPLAYYDVYVVRMNGRKMSRQWRSTSPNITTHADGLVSSQDAITGNETYYRLQPGERMITSAVKWGAP